MSKHSAGIFERMVSRLTGRRLDDAENAWEVLLLQYQAVYGVDPAPFWAHREEWQYHPGVEIDQYENGH